MKTVKMSLANIQGKMSRKEMKEISGGCGYQTWYTVGGQTFSDTKCNVSYATASSYVNTYGGSWCCSSCGSSSYCG